MVNGYSAEWLGKGFDWVYTKEVVATKGEVVPGAAVDIVAQDGRHLGVGIFAEGRVAVRRFRVDRGPIDEQLVNARMDAALRRRRISSDTTAWRWVHGENDDLPGIRVDVWADHATIALDDPSLRDLLSPILARVLDHPDIETVWENTRPTHNDQREQPAAGRCLAGDEDVDTVTVLESGLRFEVTPRMGLDAGLYPDMRDLRRWLQPYWAGKRVLNTFAYTGAFSVAAAASGATRVDTVDLASTAIARARRNFELNGLSTDLHGFWTEDTFKALDRFRRGGELFDIIVVDPPSFARGPDGVWSVEQGLSRVLSGCLRVLAPGGWILVATNQGSLSPKEFQKLIKVASLKVARRLRLIHQGSPPHDIPASMDFPESRYLKAWVLEG
jgi:23S rRNA (cytosine1962-C5)-methyltransferase